MPRWHSIFICLSCRKVYHHCTYTVLWLYQCRIRRLQRSSIKVIELLRLYVKKGCTNHNYRPVPAAAVSSTDAIRDELKFTY